jgi:hypothetical protein
MEDNVKWLLEDQSVKMWTGFSWINLDFSVNYLNAVMNIRVP